MKLAVSCFPTSALLAVDHLDLVLALERVPVQEHGGIQANTSFPLWSEGNNSAHDRSTVSYFPLLLLYNNILVSGMPTSQRNKSVPVTYKQPLSV